MTQLSDEVLIAVIGVALTSDAEEVGRVRKLAALASTCASEGECEVRDAALAEAVRVLAAARHRRGANAGEIAPSALGLGRECEELRCHKLARDAFGVGITALENEQEDPLLGLLWNGMGNAWCRDGEGAEALESYRKAAQLKKSSEDLSSRLATLLSLIEAEAQWGSPEGCDEAFAQAVSVVRTATGAGGQQLDSDLALRLGSLAEELERPAVTREAYELTAVQQ